MKKAFKSEQGKLAVYEAYDNLAKSTNIAYEEIIVKTNYGDTYMMALGDKNLPVLILLHGSGMNSLMWLNEMNIYKEHYRVYAIDMIGEPGKSAENQLPLITDDYADWLNQVLEELDVEKASFVGISLGAWLSTKFAIKYTDKVKKLVLLCPAGIGKQKQSFAFISLFYMLQGDKGLDKLFKKINGGDDIPKEILNYQKLIAKNFNFRREAVPLFSDDEIKKLTMPVCLLVGENDIMLDSKSTVDRVKRLLPNAYVKLLNGEGHSIVTFGEDIRKFLYK